MRNISLPGTERFSRLSNVSAALLHISMLNLGYNNEELRAASYELLTSVIASFNLDNIPMLSVKGESLPVTPICITSKFSFVKACGMAHPLHR